MRITRRASLQFGALSLLGMTADRLEALRAATPPTPETAKHRRNQCVFIFLFGGPSHIDLWDLKPEAPAEIRGEFRPVATNVTGIRVCEHLTHLSQRMDKLCLLRSMNHHMPVHGPACSEIYSGRPYFGPPTTDQSLPQDWPSIASMVHRFGASGGTVPTSVVLPWYSQFVGQDRRIAGQTGGRMGELHNPFPVFGDPNDSNFRIEGMKLPHDVSPNRLADRRALLGSLEIPTSKVATEIESAERHAKNRDTAFGIVGETALSRALEIHHEPLRVREAYGRTKFGQSLLLSRRLLEAGVPLITVNWDDDSRNDKVAPHWDTHYDNFKLLKERLIPLFDRTMAVFLDDLHTRGLLQQTLVVAAGEFGRTPRIGQFVQNNMTQKTGRDHWPHAFTVLLAGGGVPGGHIHGATDRQGGYVKDRPVSPADLSATILHHLGINPTREYWDGFLQMHQKLSEGTVIREW